MNLTYKQKQIHDRALKIVGRYFEVESELISILQEVDESKLYRRLNKSSLFKYATDILKLSDSVAYSLIAVARKSKQVPQLKAAIENKVLSVSKASKIVAHVTSESACELIDLASTKSAREVEAEIARRHPEQARPDRVKYISEDQVELTISISSSDLLNLARVASLEAQKGKTLSKGELVGLALNTHLEKFDPVRKARRAEKRAAKSADTSLNSGVEDRKLDCNGSQNGSQLPMMNDSEAGNSSREEFLNTELLGKQELDRQISAETIHLIYRRDHGACIHQDEDGNRCGSDRWIHFHHIQPVSEGGSNELENLATLCSFHHRLVHQMKVSHFRQLEWLSSDSPKL